MRVLLISLGQRCREWTKTIERNGYAVDVRRRVEGAHLLLISEPYDLIVLDQMVSDAHRLRPAGLPPGTGLIVVTKPDADDDRIRAIEAGADDALTAPFPPVELLLRVGRALVRRTEPTGQAVVLLGDVAIDRVRRCIAVEGERVDLTSTELCVLDHLVAHRHRVVSRSELRDHCWSVELGFESNPLPSQMNRLRRKFEGHLTFRSVERGGYQVLAARDRGHVGPPSV